MEKEIECWDCGKRLKTTYRENSGFYIIQIRNLPTSFDLWSFKGEDPTPIYKRKIYKYLFFTKFIRKLVYNIYYLFRTKTYIPIYECSKCFKRNKK